MSKSNFSISRLQLSSRKSVPLHAEGHTWEFDSPEFGLITIGFVEEDDKSISAITIDSYAFSFVAMKRVQ